MASIDGFQQQVKQDKWFRNLEDDMKLIIPYIEDKRVTDIAIGIGGELIVEGMGMGKQFTGIYFDDATTTRIIYASAAVLGVTIDPDNPIVEGVLPNWKIRIEGILPPRATENPMFFIRRPPATVFKMESYVEGGRMTQEQYDLLVKHIQKRSNIIIGGETGSGKTTLLNVHSSYIPSDERIITIEDSAEVQLHQEHVLTLEARPANMEGKGRVSIRDLVVNSLRMRPDRIIVGEVRSEETLDMLQAMNTGHDGSLTTIHANSPRDSISRIETMVMMSGSELPSKAIRDQVSSAINLIVQQARLRDGSRKVTSISELVGMEGDVVRMQDIFTYETEGEYDSNGKFKGVFKPTGIIPKCVEKIRENGVVVNNDWFND